MKILMISTVEMKKNGISTWILSYANKIKEIDPNVKIDLVSPTKISGNLSSFSIFGNVFNLSMRNTAPMIYYLKLIKIIKNNNYDIVHVHGNSCTMAIELSAAMFAGCPIRIAHSHNTVTEHFFINKLLRPIFYFSCNVRFACGEDAGKWLFKKNDFLVIKNGVEKEKFVFNDQIRKSVRKKLFIDSSNILLGHIGVFNFQKNQEFLLTLLPDLDSKYKLLLIGDGEKRSELEHEAKRKGLSDRIIFLGNTDNIQDYLQAIDIFLLPSRYEGVPFVLIESQAMGLPIIASDNVAREAKILDNMFFVPLIKDNWVDCILKINTNRKQNFGLLDNSGYSLQKNAEKLLLKYIGMVKNGKK